MASICEFCNKGFSNVSNLNYHKRTAKFCMNIQKKNEPEKNEFIMLHCEYCNKEVNKKSTLVSHLLSCKKEFFKKNKKTLLDDTVFKDFVVDCMGYTVDPKRERQLLLESRKNKGKRIIFRYEPSKDVKEADTTFFDIYKQESFIKCFTCFLEKEKEKCIFSQMKYFCSVNCYEATHINTENNSYNKQEDEYIL
mgnify:CR=1 FL=1